VDLHISCHSDSEVQRRVAGPRRTHRTTAPSEVKNQERQQKSCGFRKISIVFNECNTKTTMEPSNADLVEGQMKPEGA